MDNKYFLVVSFVVGITVGFMVGRNYSFTGGTITGGGSVAEMEQKIEKAKKFFPSIPDIRSVSGTIEEVKDGSFILKTSFSMNPFEDLPEKREVVVTSSTKIVRITQKDQKTFQKEVEASQKSFKSGNKPGKQTEPVSFPMPFIEKEITLQDLKVGDQVSVGAGENIKEKVKFEAVRVVAQESQNQGVGGVFVPPAIPSTINNSGSLPSILPPTLPPSLPAPINNSDNYIPPPPVPLHPPANNNDDNYLPPPPAPLKP